MKPSRHEILKAKWMVIIKRHNKSGLPVRKWCEENHVSPTQYYYWLRIIREESLIKAGTLAVTGQTQFVEVKPSFDKVESIHQGVCVILPSNGSEIEILNGADPTTLEALLGILKRS